jgi:hypothetical protein
MYDPPKFLTMDLLAEVLAEFQWPAPYTLEDELPDGIIVVFPRCRLFFVEGFESEMSLKFLPEDTGLDETVTLKHALVALRSDPERSGALPEPRLINYFSPKASEEKVRNGIRDLCTLVLTYLRPCLLGDFSWVERYKAYRARQQSAGS